MYHHDGASKHTWYDSGNLDLSLEDWGNGMWDVEGGVWKIDAAFNCWYYMTWGFGKLSTISSTALIQSAFYR